jgi:tagaturonate reductase
MNDIPRLSRQLVATPEFQSRTDIEVAPPERLALPEKAVQFGTGAFLRGFVEYFLEQANRKGHFGGRIVMVGSTGSGRDRVLADQDGLYTLCVQGTEAGEVRQENHVIGVVSRALSAKTEWEAVLACARDPQLELIFSNTTEVGIAVDPDDGPELAPPRSFPGKLARFLYERGRTFTYDAAYAPVVLPCELIERNGDRLREIVLDLAQRWELDPAFATWIRDHVPFCNTLVDRIVPGTPERETLERLWDTLGYRDELLTASEVYRLFVIEGDDALRRRLPFADADPGVLITGDLELYRERKVRLLNGTHTVMSPLALLCGHQTVREAISDGKMGRFVRHVLFDELAPVLGVPGADDYGHAVLDRFANPFIRHALIDIMLQATMKMQVRVVPMIERHVASTGRIPEGLALGFAAQLFFIRSTITADSERPTAPTDDRGEAIRGIWESHPSEDPATLTRAVERICADPTLWERDLNAIPGFVAAVAKYVGALESEGAPAVLARFVNARSSSVRESEGSEAVVGAPELETDRIASSLRSSQ